MSAIWYVVIAAVVIAVMLVALYNRLVALRQA